MTDTRPAQISLLIDLDGVVYQDGGLIEGAAEALDWLDSERIPHLYVTNTTSRPRDSLLRKFDRLGFHARAAEIMTPVVAARQWLAEHGLRRAALFVPPATQRDFGDIEPLPLNGDVPAEAVVLGDLGEAWDFKLLNCAFRLLMREPTPRLIALGMTRYWRGPHGLQLDVAPFVKALEHAASCTAVVVGKPAPAFFASALASLDCDAGQALMIGDDIVGDVGAAQDCGIRGIQVRTGKYRETDLDGDIEPFAVLDSIAGLPDWWSKMLAAN
ncbi:MAG TPA: TIGR01458 family HAD-type hydrolase [Gammaproteobacteria bacterium]|jgi:HAD superfamily hydrolase (TIGR01458 family)